MVKCLDATMPLPTVGFFLNFSVGLCLDVNTLLLVHEIFFLGSWYGLWMSCKSYGVLVCCVVNNSTVWGFHSSQLSEESLVFSLDWLFRLLTSCGFKG